MNLFTTPLGTSVWILSEATMERLGWVLVHSLWQFLLLAILAKVVLRLSKRSSASLRYAISGFTMAACVVLPVLTWFSLPIDFVAVATDVRNDTMETLPIESMQSPLRSSDEVAIVSDEREGAAEPPSIINRPAAESTHSVDESNDWWMNARDSLRPWLTSIVTVWILGVMICAMRPLLSWIAIRRWRRVGTTPVGKEATELMSRLMERLRIGRTVEILQSTLVHVPLVVGYVRPMILLPASLLSNLPTSQLEAIIAHELAHVRRHDFLVNFMQTIIETLFFYHPAVWWLSHRIRIERENCCDDLVVQTLGNRVEYGRALVAVEQLRADRNALALGVSDGSMLARIRRIAGQTGNGRSSSSWSLVSVLASSLPVVVIIGLIGWHSIAATPAQTASEPVAVGSILDGSFRDEVNLKLTRDDAHQGKWYFVDLDQGELKKPPFEVDIDATRFPYFVNKPSEEELSDWLKRDGVDLILRSSIYRPDPKGPIEMNEIQVRSVRTLLKELPRGLEKTETDSPSWQQALEEDVLDAFGAKDDAVHVVGFIPNTTAIDIRPDSPFLRSFRTASNLLGVFLLEQPNSNDDELRLRIAYAVNKDRPLDDLRFGPDDFVSGIESLEHPVVRKSSEASFVAKFPNDVRVEFVGLSRGVGDIKAADKWWRPDGTLLQHAPEHRGASGVLQDGDLESENPYVRTVIHVHGIGDNNAVTATAAIQSADSLKDKSGGQYVAHHGYVDAPARTRTFEVGVATDALSPKRWLDRDGKRIESKTGSVNDPVAEAITIEKVGPESWGKGSTSKGGMTDPVGPGDKKMGNLSGTTQVTVRFPLSWRAVDLRLFAIDKSGNSHAADFTIALDPNDDNADYKRLAKVIPVDYSEVDHFEYQFRVYRHWAIFENVSLWKGTQTEVVMKSETIATTSRAATSAASIPPVPAESTTVRLEVKGKDANGKSVVLMSFEEQQREEATSTVKTTYSGGGSVGSSLFIVRGACEIAKARGAAYFAKLKEWRGDDGTWMVLFGFSKNKDIRPLTSGNELKIFAVSEYEFLFNDPADANIDVIPDDQYVESGFPLDELAGEGVIWSDVQNGLSLGYRITGDEWRILGKEVKVELWVLNPAGKEVKFQLNMRPDLGLRVKLKDAKGEVHDSNFWPDDRPPLAEHCLLPPGHAIKVKEFTVSLLWESNDFSNVKGHFFGINPGTPGTYNFQCELELPGFSAAGEGGKQLTPAAGEWTGKLTTRGLNIEVIAPDAPAPKPRIESVVVRISKDGELSLDRKKMALDELKTRAAGNAKKWFTIEADDDVPYAKVIEIVDALKAVGVTNFSFAEARVGDGKYRVANRTGSYKFDEKRRFSICQPFELKQWFTVAWPANDGQPAKSLKLYPNASEQTRGTWAVVWEPGTDVLWWVDDFDIGKMTLTDPTRVIVERKGRKTSFSRDFALPDGVANEFRRLGFDIGGKPGEPLVIGGPTSRQEILSAEPVDAKVIPDKKDATAPKG